MVIRALGRGGVAPGGFKIVGDEHAFGHAPVRRIGAASAEPAALDIVRPVGLDPLRQQKIRRDRLPAARRRWRHALRMRRDHGDDDRRMRLLIGFGNAALVAEGRALGRDRPVFARQVIGRIARPQRQHMVHRLDQHVVAIPVVVAEQFRIGAQIAGADAHDEAALGHVIDHRDLRGDRRRMMVRHVDRAGAELDVPGLADQRSDENERGGDALGRIGDVLADETFGEAELVRDQGELAVLLEHLRVIAPGRVHRHDEEPELHGGLRYQRSEVRIHIGRSIRPLR